MDHDQEPVVSGNPERDTIHRAPSHLQVTSLFFDFASTFDSIRPDLLGAQLGGAEVGYCLTSVPDHLRE